MTATERAMCTEAEDRIRELEAKNEGLRLGINIAADMLEDGTAHEGIVRTVLLTALAPETDEKLNDGETDA